MPKSRAILIAVTDGVLADSLRFSLELEGFETKFCDERTLLSPRRGRRPPDCLVIDQDVFVRLVEAGAGSGLAGLGVPVVLMVGQESQRVLECARAAGVTKILEKPLLGSVLLEAIRNAVETRSGPAA